MATINECPIIKVDEFLIRFPRYEDAEKIVEYFQKNRNHLKPWEPTRGESFYSVQGWQHRLTQLAKLQQHELAFYFLIFSNEKEEEIWGIITYSNVSHYPLHCANVGYSLSEHVQSRGIMRKSLRLTCQWVFDTLNLHRITAAYMPKNHRSAKVLKSVGFVIEGEAKAYLLINGKWEDHILTSLINHRWKAPW